jgi:hypothetical protein
MRDVAAAAGSAVAARSVAVLTVSPSNTVPGSGTTTERVTDVRSVDDRVLTSGCVVLAPQLCKQGARALTVTIADDGVGGAEPGRGTGLRGLADRLAMVDGTLDVQSPPGGGTRIRARIPLPGG